MKRPGSSEEADPRSRVTGAADPRMRSQDTNPSTHNKLDRTGSAIGNRIKNLQSLAVSKNMDCEQLEAMREDLAGKNCWKYK